MSQRDYGINRQPAYNGMADDATGRVRTLTNDNPRAAQVDDIQVSTVTNGATYSVTIDTIILSIIASAADAATIRNQLIDKINGDWRVNGTVKAEVKDADELTLTALNGGIGYTLQVSSNLTATSVQANAEADPVPFGVIVVFDDMEKKTGKLAKATNFIAQVDTHTLVFDDGVLALVNIEVGGENYHFQHAMATDANTSVTALAAQINAALPAETVDATVDGDDLVLTSELAGKAFKSSTGFGTGRDTGTWTKASNASIETDLNLAYAGISQAVATQAVKQGATEAEYQPGYPMSIRHDQARLRVVPEEDVAANTEVYVRLAASGSNTRLGGLRATPDTGCVKLEGARFIGRLNNVFARVEVP